MVRQHWTTSATSKHAAPAHSTLAAVAPAPAPLVTAQPRDVWIETATGQNKKQYWVIKTDSVF